MNAKITERDLEVAARCKAPLSHLVLFVEWLADQTCTGNGSGKLCRINSPDDPSWCCYACRAWLLCYGNYWQEEK